MAMTNDVAPPSPRHNSLLPPIPKHLTEMLKDYPEHLDRLQETLNQVAEEPPSVSTKFEVVTWMLQGQLEEFFREARAELEAAQATEDGDAVARAREKGRLMSQACWKHIWIGDEALWEYFQSS
ncbi:hypothetical protein [Lysobacter sp. CA196]|uniref:hypothetical protein n=1 Tax=Lysobacter sp. CA196 TaxID=3455606 RepID=UPI003F8D3E90